LIAFRFLGYDISPRLGIFAMNEQVRTYIHVGIAAAVALLVGVELSRSYGARDVTPVTDKPLFPDFKDPLLAKRLLIKRFDEKLGDMQDFEVAEVDGRWVIPSKNNYPADAQDRLRDAAATVIDLKPLTKASDVADDHQQLGVIEPVEGKTKPGDEGVGTLVAVQDAKGDDLFKLIVGKEATSKEDNLPGQRFVRKPGEDVVWVAKIDMEKLPTDFDQWIEKDLLKLNALDVQKVTLKDLNFLPTNNGRFLPYLRMDATVAWNTEKGEWKLQELVRYDKQQKPVQDGLGPQEELNKQKLDDLKTALDDLKIINVRRKPKGVDGSLKVTKELIENQEEILSNLQELGFYPLRESEGKLEIGSANGEVIIDMKDGVQYVLRFGAVASDIKGAVEGKMNRYLFVTTQLSPDLLQPPQLIDEPAVPAGPNPDSAPAPKKADSEKKNGGGGAEQNEASQPDSAKTDPTKDPAKTDPDATDPAKPGPPPVVDLAKEAAERVRKENRRKMDEWDDKKKKATARVTELNARFADWYYVISEDVYKKVHLSRADIVKEASSAKDEGIGIDAFRELERGGIKQLQPTGPAGGPGGPGPGAGRFNPDTFRNPGFDQ
jgi:hypothetical protein